MSRSRGFVDEGDAELLVIFDFSILEFVFISHGI